MWVTAASSAEACSIPNTHPFNGPLSGTNQVSRYQKGKTNLDFTEARDSEWQWHQLGHMQVRTLLQTDNHASTPPLSFLQAGCPSCRPTNSVKALKANAASDTRRITMTMRQSIYNAVSAVCDMFTCTTDDNTTQCIKTRKTYRADTEA